MNAAGSRSIAAGARLLLLAAYAAIAVWITWPLATRATTDLPAPTGQFRQVDVLSAAWLLAWHTHALTTDPTRLAHPNAFHPARSALFYAPPALGPLPFFAPAYLASGSASLAYDFAFLAGMAIAALSVAEVVLRWTHSVPAAVVAGIAFLACPTLRTSTGTAPLCAMLIGLPWIVYGGARRPLDTRSAAWLVAALVLQGLVDPIFATVGALAPLGVIACVRMVRRDTRADGWRLVACAVLSCVLLSPLFIGYVAAWHGLDPVHLGPWSAPLAPILAGIPAAETPSLATAIPAQPSVVWFASACIALGAWLAWRRGHLGDAAWRHAFLWTAVGLVFSGSPVWYALVTGHADIVDQLGPLRSLERLSADMLAGVPLLIGLGMATVFRLATPRVRPAVVATALALALMAASPRAPYPTLPAPILAPEIRAAIMLGNGPVLYLPAGRTIVDAAALYRSIGEWWPMLNGYASFWPPGYGERVEDAKRLPDREVVQRLVADTGVRAVVVSLPALRPAERRVWVRSDAPAQAGLRRVANKGGDIAFIVDR